MICLVFLWLRFWSIRHPCRTSFQVRCGSGGVLEQFEGSRDVEAEFSKGVKGWFRKAISVVFFVSVSSCPWLMSWAVVEYSTLSEAQVVAGCLGGESW